MRANAFDQACAAVEMPMETVDSMFHRATMESTKPADVFSVDDVRTLIRAAALMAIYATTPSESFGPLDTNPLTPLMAVYGIKKAVANIATVKGLIPA